VTTIITTKNNTIQLEKKIDLVTKYCKPFTNKILKDLSIKNFENANIICDYIIAEQIEFDIKPTTKIGKIKALVYLSHSCNDEKSFKEITKQDILDHLNTFRKSISKDPANRWIGTYNFRQMIFNKFFRWVFNPDEPDTTKREKPECMKGVKKLPRKQKSSYNSGNIWDQRDNLIFLKYCHLARDRCFHAMAMDTSCRPHELLGLKIKDIEFSYTDDGKHYALVRIKHGKTGPRTVPLIDSLPYLKEWIQQEHPTSSNLDSWLFVSTGNNHGSQLTYEGLVNRYDYFKKKYFPSLLADPTIPDPDKSVIRNLLTKPFNPYVLRHSSLTEKSTLLTESVLRSHAGWSADSSMPKVYIHLRDESSKILLEKRGILIKKDKETSIITKTKICVNCQEPNRPNSQWCISCKMILSYNSYKETLDKQKEKDEKIKGMESQIEKQGADLKKAIETIVVMGKAFDNMNNKFQIAIKHPEKISYDKKTSMCSFETEEKISDLF
jgi:integrase